MAKQPKQIKKPSPDDVGSWPVIWRVVAPQAGAYGRDWVFLETDSEAEARSHYQSKRSADWPVRLEQVHCGPLPYGSHEALVSLREANGGLDDGEEIRPAGAWERPARRKAVAHG